jgi:hypothetical protein
MSSVTGAAREVVVAIEVPRGPVVDTLLDRGFAVYSINPKVLDRLRDRFSVAGAKDDQRDAYVLADGVRNDWRLFRRIQVSDPRFIELRAWSRLAEELQEERIRLSNRVHHKFWRYYPQMLKLSPDAAAPWLLELWTIAPTPNKGSQLRSATVERLLKQHRIRRVTAEIAVGTLKEPAITVDDGVAAAACAHMRSLVARLRLVNRELRESEHKLDEFCSAVGEVDAASGQGLHPPRFIESLNRNPPTLSRTICALQHLATISPRWSAHAQILPRRVPPHRLDVDAFEQPVQLFGR